MPYDPREIEDVKKKQREATGNVVTNVSGRREYKPLGEAEKSSLAEETAAALKELFSASRPLQPIDVAEEQSDWHDSGVVSVPGTYQLDDPAPQQLSDEQVQQMIDRIPEINRIDAAHPEIKMGDDATLKTIFGQYPQLLEALRKGAPHVQDIKLEPKSASTTAPHYATTWSVGQVDAPVLPGFKAPKTLTWTDATGTTTESPLWADVWQMNDMFDPHDLTATLNIQGKPHSVQVGTRFTNGDEVTDIELAPMRVGSEEGQEVGVWRIRLTPKSEDDQDYFVYSEDVDASQIVEGGEAATSRESEKEDARKKADAAAAAADAEASAAATRDAWIAELIPASLDMGRGDLRYRFGLRDVWDGIIKEELEAGKSKEYAEERAQLGTTIARGQMAAADLEKWSAEVGVRDVTTSDDPFERTELNDGQVYIKSPEGDVYNVSALSDQEIDKFYVDTYDDTTTYHFSRLTNTDTD